MPFHSVPDYIRALAPYQASKPVAELARELGIDEASLIQLASNENPLGTAPSVREAMSQAFAHVSRYPDGHGFALKNALTEKYGVPESWITLGNGSSDILDLAVRAFVQTGQSIIYAQYSFVIYEILTKAIGARAIVVPAREYGHDLDAMLAAIAPDTRLIFITNPNNPTGTFLSAPVLENFLSRVPTHVLILLDEAYTEYLPDELEYDSIGWIQRYPNLIISRTFSKAYGLAGLRIGFGIAQPSVIELLNRIRPPFNVNVVAQAAAVAALKDPVFLQKSRELNLQGYRQLTDAFTTLNLEYVPSFGNFVLVKIAEDAATANRINLALLKQGIIVRAVGSYGLPNWLRITIGLPDENRALIAALKNALG